MFNKIINKIFFTKRVFKVIIVLTFFVSLWLFYRLCLTYENPYSFYGAKNYTNLIEFVEEELVSDSLFNHPFDYHEFLYEQEFIGQAMEKKIINVSEVDRHYRSKAVLALALSCEPNKLKEFKEQYKKFNNMEYVPYDVAIEKSSINCEKAKSVTLEPENYYFVHYYLGVYLLASFVAWPIAVLLVWVLLRFVFIAPILWAVRKD